MARGGRKHPLIVYKHLVNRWWTPMFAIGIVMFVLAYGEYTHPIWRFIAWRWQVFVSVGILAMFTGFFFLILKGMAYVQVLPGYLKFVTPFFRFNISFKRIHKTTTTEMKQIFAPKNMSGWVKDIFEPLASQTAIVIELKGFPISPVIMHMFLSRFFFKDKTPHIVLLVKDWMGLSSEIDSYRSGGDPYSQQPQRSQIKDSLLSKLSKK